MDATHRAQEEEQESQVQVEKKCQQGQWPQKEKKEKRPRGSYSGTYGMNIGAALKILRSKEGLTQAALGAISGVAANHISLIEQNRTNPSTFILQALCRSFKIKISLSEFFILAEGLADENNPFNESTNKNN